MNKTNLKNTIIIGGGASALMCALVASQNGTNVTILEAGNKVGKKILVSGNGRCNFTNKNFSHNCYNQNITKYLKQFNNENTTELFNKLGLESYYDEEGRFYPVSNLSSSVLDVILNKLEKQNCEIITQTKVEVINVNSNGYELVTNNGNYTAQNVVLCCGGNALGNMIEHLGVKTKPFVPSLCALKTSEYTKTLSGIRLSGAEVKLVVNGKEYTECGEVLFKDEGLSGICIMNLSAHLARQNNYNAQILINLCPNLTKQQLVNKLLTRKENLFTDKLSKFFVGFTHKSVGLELLKRAGLNENNKVGSLSLEQINKLACVLQELKFNVVGTYDNNQVFSGGIELGELTENLELKKHKNFYVCGEACDVDGLCGGYNLQWAWTSGKIVGEKLKND